MSEPAWRRLFDAGRHKTIATPCADGSLRASGIECEFTDGDLRFGSMTGARKVADLKRGPRFALHGPTFHPEVGKEQDWPGEANKQPDGQMFVADITEVVITGLNAEATSCKQLAKPPLNSPVFRRSHESGTYSAQSRPQVPGGA